MKRLFLFIAILFSIDLYSQSEGEKLFNQTCIACHSIGQGKIVGPDLKGVETRHTMSWLKLFVTSSQSMIKKGDTSAVNLFKQNNGMIMPDQKLSGKEIESLIAFIKEKGATIQPEASAMVVAEKLPSTEHNDVVEKQNKSNILQIISFVPWVSILIIVILLAVIYVLADVIRAMSKLVKSKRE